MAKLTFAVAIKIDDKNIVGMFSNNAEGFSKFVTWLKKHSSERYHCCLESTGNHSYALALFLYNNNYAVSIVNPARIKYFMRSQLSRNKTDPVDAKFIRHYCELFSPNEWRPLPLEIQELQALVRRLDILNDAVLQEQNRLENVSSIIKKSIDNHIKYLNKEIKKIEETISKHVSKHSALKANSELLKSIPGIGEKTTNKTLAFLSHAQNLDKAKQLAAFIGLNPQHVQSETSLNYSHISRTGDAALRKMFYMPALVAIQHEPNIKIFYEKLVNRGKPKKVAICAVMRKLVYIIYGVFKSQTPFNSNLIRSH